MLTDDERKTIEHAARMLADEADNKRRTIHAAVFGHTHADTLDSLAAKLRAIAAPRVAPSPTPGICAAIEQAAAWIELGEIGATPDGEALVATLRGFTRAPRVATVGELLEPAHIVEFMFEGDWHQAKRATRLRYWQVRYWTGAHWSSWSDSYCRVDEAWCVAARLVPLADIDASPDSRGPIGEG